MLELNILAVQNADVLRALASPADRRALPSLTALAAAIGRDKSNLSKTLKILEGADLLLAEPLANGLTSDGLLQLEAINRAETAEGGDALPDGLLALRHDQILPDPDNARQDWTSDEAKDELDALRADIVKNGLLQNLVVRPMAEDDLQDAYVTVTTPAGDEILPRYRLVAGERRWRAIGEAINDGDWEAEEPILTRLLDRDAKETRFAAIAENLLRRKLNPIEKAKGFEQLAELGFENKLIAERLGYTPEHVQQHRRFLKLEEADQQRMTLPRDDPKHLSVRDARQKLTAKDNAPKPINMTPTVRLAWIEVTHAALSQSTPGNLWNEVVVAASAADAWELQELVEIGALRLEGPKTHNPLVGRFTVRRAYQANHLIVADPIPLEGLLGKERDAILRAEQAKVNNARNVPWPSSETHYLTAWLEDIGELTEEGAALAEAARAAAEQRDKENRDRADAIAARNAVWAEARQRHLRLLTAAQERPEAGQPDEVVSIASDLDRPLPWQALPSGIIAAANGTTVKTRDHYGAPSEQELAINQMIVVAANAAGGVLTPTPAAPDAPSEEEFVEAIAAVAADRRPDLTEEQAADLAAQILASFLDDNGVAFGEDGFDWTHEGAVILTDEHLAAGDTPTGDDGTADADADQDEAA
ncbi:MULTISPECIES: ParB N-terminal domain-containing protein [unclassified Brevundimonas]|uniref:ParB N-terminal domain-containing protein n=1 Tax=unclassified Brevundimonas TaxID=2622653 RepID=UPI0025BD42BB|nr:MULTISPECIES: ParB N-terminal domain-containing protein [unclassified Brevundimonas]